MGTAPPALPPWSEPSPPASPFPPSPPAPPFPPPAPPTYEAGLIVVGILLSFVGAILLGLAMPLQRYCLTYPKPRVPIFGSCTVSKFWAWILSLCVYGAANGLNASAQQMAPLSLLSSVFTLMIVRAAVSRTWRQPIDTVPPRAAGATRCTHAIAMRGRRCSTPSSRG